MKLSIIIPTLNEEAIIQSRIAGIRAENTAIEIIVADGGSKDATVLAAREMGVRVCLSDQGRGIQCNAGAAIARGNVLMFLHSDTSLPEGAVGKLERLFSDDRVQCGTFRIAFDINHWLLRFLAFWLRFDPGFFRFGDQCLVIRKSLFTRLGGFPVQKLFEDLELVRRARRKTRIHCFPMTVTSSARRFLRNGFIRQQAQNIWLTTRYYLGTPPAKLADEYERRNGHLQNAALIVFMRYPRPGTVKTRLAATLGDQTAVDFYKVCAAHLMQEIRSLPGSVNIQVWYTGGTAEEMKDWLGRGIAYWPQPEGSLGTKLTWAFDQAFHGGTNRVIAMASDVPDLGGRLVLKAALKLDSSEMVIGPTFDGGYYLIGLRKNCPAIFQNISWSTDKVYPQTVAAGRSEGLKFSSLPRLLDVDTGADLRACLNSAKRNTLIAEWARNLEWTVGK